MKRKIQALIALLLCLAMALSVSGCARRNRDDSQGFTDSTPGKEINRAVGADEVFSLNSNSEYSLNPLIATNHANQLICCLVYENLVELDNSFNVIPKVIESWETEDGISWKLHLAQGHVFHDGSAVTGKDVRNTIERAIVSDRFSGRFSTILGVSHDDTTVYVTLAKADMQFIKLLNIPLIKSGTFQDAHPIGSGPYAYNEDGSAIVAYSGYPGYENLPVDTVYIKEYQTADSIISAFEDSYIDVVLNDPSGTTNLGFASTNEVHSFATTNMHYVAFNEESLLGRYPQFRIAMQFAFDRAYLPELLNGNAVASALPMYPTCADYPKQTADYLEYNLETCKRALESAGVQDYDDDGRLEFMSGSPQEIEINFIVNSDSSAKAGMARRFAESMDSIGLTVNVSELTWDEYVKALEEGEFDMYYGEVKLRNNFDITELLEVRVDDEDDDDYNAKTNINYTRSKDVNFETYIDSYLAAGDAGRSHAFQTLCEYVFSTTGSLIVLGFEEQELISHRGIIRGIDANQGNPLYGFENWEIELT